MSALRHLEGAQTSAGGHAAFSQKQAPSEGSQMDSSSCEALGQSIISYGGDCMGLCWPKAVIVIGRFGSW